VLGHHSCLQVLIAICPLFKVVDGGGVIHDPRSWAVGFAGCHLSLFMGCGSFVAMAVICGVVVVFCGHSQGVVGSHCHFSAVISR